MPISRSIAVFLALTAVAPARASTYACAVDSEAEEPPQTDAAGDEGPSVPDMAFQWDEAVREGVRPSNGPRPSGFAWVEPIRHVDLVVDVSGSIGDAEKALDTGIAAATRLTEARSDATVRLVTVPSLGLEPRDVPANQLGDVRNATLETIAKHPRRLTPLAATIARLESETRPDAMLVVVTDGFDWPREAGDDALSASLLLAEAARRGGKAELWTSRTCTSPRLVETWTGQKVPPGWRLRGDCLVWTGPEPFLDLRASPSVDSITDAARMVDDPGPLLDLLDASWALAAEAPARGPAIDVRPLEADQFRGVGAVAGPFGYHCSGVLVGDRVVITARHCLPATRVTFAANVAEAERAYDVIATVPHPDEAVDVALLALDGAPGAERETIRSGTDREVPFGMVRAVGYGAVDAEGSVGFGRRHVTDLPAAGWGCDRDRAGRIGCLPDLEMVLRSAVRDTCRGDSGGAVYEPWIGTAEAAAAAGLGDGMRLCGWRLVAITSRPVANSRVSCGDGGIYTRVDALQPWLDHTVRDLEGS